MNCSICNFENKLGAKFCAKCGSPFALQSPPLVATKTCGSCQFACKPDAKFCPKCGNDFSIGSQNSAPIEVIQSPPTQPETLPTLPVARDIVAPATVAAVAELEPCPHCGAAVKRTTAFCGKCGQKITRGIAVDSQAPIAPPAVSSKSVEPTNTPSTSFTPVGGNETTPQPKPQPPAPPPVRPPSPQLRSTERGEKPPIPVKVFIIAGCTLTALLIAGGAYYALSGKATTKPGGPAANVPATATSTPSPAASAAVAAPAVAASPSATASESVGSATSTVAPPASTASAPTSMPVATPAPVEKPVSPLVVAPEQPVPALQPKPEKKAKAPPPVAAPRDSTIDNAVAASLAEASQCMARKQYDCVIANADGALRLDRGNARAQELKRQAKEAQNRALSQIQIQ